MRREKTDIDFRFTERADELLEEKEIEEITIKVEQRGGG